MKNIITPLLLLLTCLTSTAQQSFTWSRVADYPYQAWGMTSCNLNGALYTFSNCGTSNNTLYRYTAANDKWDTLAKLPGATFCNTAMAGVGGKIYLLGNTIMHEYDVTTDTWSNSVSLPAGLKKDGASMIVYGNDIYIAGGGTSTTVNFFKFSTNTQAFSQLTPMSTPRENAQVALLADKIYVIAGRRSGASLNTAEVYDIATDTWSSISLTFQKRYFGFAIADKQYIYIMGGETGVNSFKYKNIELYDPANNTVTTLSNTNDMNVEHTAYALGISGTKLVAAAGFTNTPSNNITTEYCESTEFSNAVNILQVKKQSVDFNIFPNPATSKLFIKPEQHSNIVAIRIYNTAGQLIKNVENLHNQEQVAVNISMLSDGVYFIKAFNASGFCQQRTFLINR